MDVLHKNTITRGAAHGVLYSLFKSCLDRIRHHAKERDCFMVFMSQGWVPFSGSTDNTSTRNLIHSLSEGR